jgi:hypothetical protein
MERFVLDYNARFAVPAAEPGSAFVPYAGRPLDEDVLCRQLRVLAAASRSRRSATATTYVRATVRVHHYPDGSLAIFDGLRCLARFNPNGEPNDAVSQAAQLRSAAVRPVGLVDKRLAPQAQQQQRERTIDVLQIPDIFTRYRHGRPLARTRSLVYLWSIDPFRT